MKLDQSFMAQLLQTLTNQYGGSLSIRKREGKIEVIKSADMSKRVLSQKQKDMNILMKIANSYARDILSDENLKDAAQLRLNVPSNRLYHALIKEFFHIENGKKDYPFKVKTTIDTVPGSQINQVSTDNASDVPGLGIA
jgi:hypothetical protein